MQPAMVWGGGGGGSGGGRAGAARPAGVWRTQETRGCCQYWRFVFAQNGATCAPSLRVPSSTTPCHPSHPSSSLPPPAKGWLHPGANPNSWHPRVTRVAWRAVCKCARGCRASLPQAADPGVICQTPSRRHTAVRGAVAPACADQHAVEGSVHKQVRHPHRFVRPPRSEAANWFRRHPSC